MTRTTVVTGSASGIGKATAELLRSSGHRVIGVDLHEADVTADLSTAEGRSSAIDTVTSLADGTLDGIIAAAGISAPKPLTIAVNFFGVVALLEGLRPLLAASNAPRATVVSSIASIQPNSTELVDAILSGDERRALQLGQELTDQSPRQGYLNYSSSKRALSRWVRRASISEPWAGSGIPLNAVAPGTVLSPMTSELLATPESRQMVDANVPMPLNGHSDPIVIARMLAWLTSDENTHVTGQTVYIDGGAEASLRGDDIWTGGNPRS